MTIARKLLKESDTTVYAVQVGAFHLQLLFPPGADRNEDGIEPFGPKELHIEVFAEFNAGRSRDTEIEDTLNLPVENFFR